MGQTKADLGLGRWIAQKSCSLNGFPFHSALYHPDLDLLFSGSRVTTEMLTDTLQCVKWLVVMDACPPRLSY